MRFCLILIFFTITVGGLFANEYTDILLDQAIEEFSRENYEEALMILDEVLKVEPDNTTAQMYKKTIEDVAAIGSIEESDEKTEVPETTDDQIIDSSEAVVNSDNAPAKKDIDYLHLSTLLGATQNSKFVVEQRIKLFLGLPIFEVGIKTDLIGYDIFNDYTDFSSFQDVNIMENNIIDVSMGLRYVPNEILGDKPGFFDFKFGMTRIKNYSIDEENKLEGDYNLPFVGYDFEVHMLKFFGSNIITDTLWVGSKGSLLFHESNADNNFLEFKGGLKIGFINLGAFYNITDINSLNLNNESFGIILGMVF